MERYIRKIVYFECADRDFLKGNRVPHYKYEERKGKVRIAFTIDSMYIQRSGRYTLFLILEKDKSYFFREIGYFFGGMKGQIDRLFEIILEEGENVKGVLLFYEKKPLFIGYQEERIQIEILLPLFRNEKKSQNIKEQDIEVQDIEDPSVEDFQIEEEQIEQAKKEGMNQLFEKSKKLLPFQYNNEGLEWISIRIYDLDFLPEGLRVYKDNAFLINCEQIYKHLLFGRDKLNKCFLIGVPDVYSATEKMLANIFGFYEFLPCKEENPVEESYGYWIIREKCKM